VLETDKRRKEKRCKRLGLVQPRLSSVWHTGLSSGAPDSVWCARLKSGEQAALGRIWRRTTIIHRTVWWCTGLSGEPTAASATVGRAIRGRRVARANGRQGAPDCPVRHPTEGKISLPRLSPTAPSCLGAIKGTARRMEESPKLTRKILRLQDSILTHLIL
jgi:hypothetical protein